MILKKKMMITNFCDNDCKYRIVPRILMILTTVIYDHDKNCDCQIAAQVL